MLMHESFRKVGLSKIVEVSESARVAAPDFEKRTGKPFIYFQRGEVGFATPSYIIDALADGIRKGFTKYPKSGGEPWFKEAVVAHLREMNVEGLGPEHVLATDGGQEALQLIFSAHRGGRVVGFVPCWSCMFENILPYSEFSFDPIALRADNEFQIPFDIVEQKIRSATIFYLNTPHNPTGKVFTDQEIARLCELCARHDVLLVSDEAYKDLVYPGHRHVSPLAVGKCRMYAAHTFSKTFAATGFRVGYAVCNDPTIISTLIRAEYTQTAGVPTPLQYAFAQALTQRPARDAWLGPYVAELQARRDLMRDLLNLPAPGGAFYYFLDLTSKFAPGADRDARMLHIFMENGIAVVPGSAFGADYAGYVRLSFSAMDRTLIEEGTRRVRSLLAALS